ncbi:PIN domain nuclease [Oceanobacillus chungangensis]|nr:PIN domain nuclease [Oceanobacillus chungangensis]
MANDKDTKMTSELAKHLLNDKNAYLTEEGKRILQGLVKEKKWYH